MFLLMVTVYCLESLATYNTRPPSDSILAMADFSSARLAGVNNAAVNNMVAVFKMRIIRLQWWFGSHPCPTHQKDQAGFLGSGLDTALCRAKMAL